MQLIDSSERAGTLLSNVPEWHSNQLPRDYEPEVPTTTLSLHDALYSRKDKTCHYAETKVSHECI